MIDVKMSDVAKLANVSPATVSRVLRQPDLVSKEKRDRVLKVVNELNYKPHMVASQFRTKETRTILVIIPDISTPFFSEVLRGIQHSAANNGYKVIIGDSENNVEKEKEFIDLLLQKQADGVILLTARMEQKSLEIISNQFPTVIACEYSDGLDVATVSIDNISSSRKVTEHLIEMGHRRIAHIAGPMEVILSRDRIKGYRQALMTEEIPIDPAYIQEGDFSIQSGYEQMMKLLSLELPPTAVFAFNDELAIGAIKAVRDSGKHVPNDVAIAGFDNITISSYLSPEITTIDQPKYDIGKQAMSLLLKLMNGEQLDRKKIVLDDELLIRESSSLKVNALVSED